MPSVGLRLTLFTINSDTGLGAGPMPPLAFFLGGAPLVSSQPLPPPPLVGAGRALALSEEDLVEEVLA